MNTRNSTPEPTVWPGLHARDAHALIDFLVDTVGFTKTAVYADGDLVAHAQLDWPEGGGVMLGSIRPGDQHATQPGTAGLYVVTDHLDAVYERVREAGAKITREPAEQPYGNRDFSLKDPEGNTWTFGHYRGEPRRE